MADIPDEIKEAFADLVDILTGAGKHAAHEQRQVGRCVYCSCGEHIQGLLRSSPGRLVDPQRRGVRPRSSGLRDRLRDEGMVAVIGWLIGAAYLAAAIVTSRLSYAREVEDDRLNYGGRMELDFEERAFSCVLGLVWPMLVVMGIGYLAVQAVTWNVQPPRSVRLARKVEERDRRIADLERELGIGRRA